MFAVAWWWLIVVCFVVSLGVGVVYLFGLFWCVALSFVVLLVVAACGLFRCINSVVIMCYLSV